MSDFLTRLAARAVGAAPVIQPRLPSLFESGGQPQRRVEVDVQRETPAIDQNNRTVTAETQAGTISQPPPLMMPFGETRPISKTEIDQRSRQAVITTPPLIKPTADPGQPFTVSSEPTPSAQPTIEVRDKAASPHIVERLRDATTEPTVIDREQASEWPLIKPKVRQLISDRLSGSSTPQPGVERPEQKTGEASPGAIPIAAPIQPPPTRHVEILIREPGVISEAPAPINVTIGRVDVRAVFAPAAQSPRVINDKRSQTSSLDEYLKKRSGVSR